MMRLELMLTAVWCLAVSFAFPSPAGGTRSSAKVADQATMLYQRIVDEALNNHPQLMSQTYADLRALGRAKVDTLQKAAKLAEMRFPVAPEMYVVRLVPTTSTVLDTRAYHNAVERFERMYQPMATYRADVEAQARLLNEAGHHLQAMEAERLCAFMQVADMWATHPRDDDAEKQLEAIDSFQPCVKDKERAAEQSRSLSWRANELTRSLESLRFP